MAAGKKLLAALRNLQARFARVDECAIRARLAKQGRKAKLLRLEDHVALRIYRERNHRLPHFHLEFKKQYAASYAIATGERLAGKLPAKYENVMLTWARRNSALLLREWKNLNSGEDMLLTLSGGRER